MTSQLNVDTIKGKTTEGSITVQGEGSKTTNLQQGLLVGISIGSHQKPATNTAFGQQ